MNSKVGILILSDPKPPCYTVYVGIYAFYTVVIPCISFVANIFITINPDQVTNGLSLFRNFKIFFLTRNNEFFL